ncbi:RNA polymerase sigma factor [Intestinibacter sp.]|uniref:RNA polymerase sigma factor n=1 Tax=Intestinibacter sp. TaxID=1965304 RepID=UPI002A755B79|nr:sigma factor-like helix-turn-helix DNA-binding protein [Intestinibacter sp.]MDY2734999.1 sigma factor-like helix-turn-helix DNA-binding protein [Intestinibacter sp.]MDY4573807.1 sigma factor-like helix-turn-helix DNA-binding protein [Intestinibacter sp.]
MDNILKAVNGNKKAIKQLIRDYSKQMYKLIFLHTKYEEDSKIILRDTICFIKENISKLDEDQDVILWIYKIIIINTNNFLESVGMVENDINIEDYYNNGKISLYNAIDLLDGKYKSVLILKYYFELSYEEIGEVVDLNADTVQIYIRQSLKKIKASVGEYL